MSYGSAKCSHADQYLCPIHVSFFHLLLYVCCKSLCILITDAHTQVHLLHVLEPFIMRKIYI